MKAFIFIICLLLAGCVSRPANKTVYIGPMQGVPIGLIAVHMPSCCGSMKPAINGGELAYVERYHGQSGLTGYIVSTKKFTHRVVGETATEIVTAGDNNWGYDHRTPKSEIVYIVRYIVHNEKK